MMLLSSFGSVIVNDLDGVRTVFDPLEADAVLVIDSYRLLALAIPFQSLQVVARGTRIPSTDSVAETGWRIAARKLDRSINCIV